MAARPLDPGAAPGTDAPLGLMGGTFDPVHHAHLRLALDAAEALQLPQVRWIPSGAPGHRDAPAAPAADRLAMLQLALADEPRFDLDAAELDCDAPTYTIHTLQRLRDELGPTRPLVMIVGMDSFISLATWREWQGLFELAHFAVAARPGYELQPDALPQALAREYRARHALPAEIAVRPHGCIVHFPSTLLDISASDIRARIAHGASPRYLIPETVLRYIESKALYR